MLYPSVLCSVLSLEDQAGSCVFFILALIPFVSFFFSVTFHSLEDLLSHGTKKCPPTQSYRTAQRSEGQMHGHGGLRDMLCPVSRGSSQRGLKVTCCQLSWVPAWEHGTSSR